MKIKTDAKVCKHLSHVCTWAAKITWSNGFMQALIIEQTAVVLKQIEQKQHQNRLTLNVSIAQALCLHLLIEFDSSNPSAQLVNEYILNPIRKSIKL